MNTKNFPGQLDPTFGQDGLFVFEFDDVDRTFGASIAELDAHHFWAGFDIHKGADCAYRLACFNDRAEVEKSFDGRFIDAGYTLLKRIFSLSDQGWLVSGETNGGTPRLCTAKHHADGSLDLDYGTNGKAVIDLLTLGDVQSLLARNLPIGNFKAINPVLQPDGKLLMGGTLAYNFNDLMGIVVRLDAGGALDLSFNAGGYVIINPTGYESSYNELSCIALQSDGKVLTGGLVSDPQNAIGLKALIGRYKVDGSVDHSYGQRGHVVFEGPSPRMEVLGLTVLSNNRLLAMGRYHVTEQGWILELQDNGAPLPSFNQGAPTFTEFTSLPGRWLQGASLHSTNGEQYLAIGSLSETFINESGVALGRFDSNGTADTHFGDQGNGVVETLRHGLVPLLRQAIIQADGNVLVCARTLLTTNPPRAQGAFYRYLTQ